MSIKYLITVLAFLFLAGIYDNPVSATERKETASIGAAASTLDDQTGVALTIYNANLGLIKDQRQIKLFKGTGDLRFMDVSSQIIPTSVQVKSLVNPKTLRILEQNYEYDLLNPQKLLDKYVGKEVKLYIRNPYTEREDVVTATLLSNNGQPIFKIGDEITFGHPGRVVFPGVPENLNAKPTLIWMIENSLSPTQKIEASYLTRGINWQSDYVVILNEKSDKAALSGWVTIDNHSGATYRNAKLKLVAGNINQVKDELEYGSKMMPVAQEAAKTDAPMFKEDSFFEYHIYTLDRPATIKDNQTKQISLVAANDIPAKKELLYSGAKYYYYSRYGDVTANKNIGVYIEIQNIKEHNLGIPLPKGVVRVYMADKEGSLQFTGEDAIDHTPNGETVRIKVGDAFDVVGRRKQTDWKKTAYDTYEAAFEISLRNHKKEDVVVKVVEPIPGEWTMLSSSYQFKKTDAFTAEFNVPVPKDKEVKLTYRVRMRY
jgi:hypothetical protein